jgi:aryl sulfotransferase
MRMNLNSTLPEQGNIYLGPITNTNRWENFQYRADDIFVCTPPKCGTTWTQAICAMLIFGKVDHGMQPGVISPWIDAEFAPIEEDLLRVEEQTHRRYIKTHTPLDGIPYHSECTYLVVMRDPRDVYFSGLNHRDNMTDEETAHSAFPSGDNAFSDWLSAVREPDTWDLQSLHSLTHFFKSYWDYRDLPNVHMFHYSDMKRDLTGTIGAMAKALNVACDEEQLKAYAIGASFDTMKKNADQFAPGAGTGIWKAEAKFFANGTSNQWLEKLTKEDLFAFDTRLGELLPADEGEWLLNGNG